jgi:hypothetical protein
MLRSIEKKIYKTQSMKAVREVLNKADASMHAEEGQVSPSEQWANAMKGPIKILGDAIEVCT